MILLSALLCLALPAAAAAVQDDPWAAVRFLAGEWVAGDGGGQPGQASRGESTFRFELDGKVLARRSFAEYPAAAGRPAFRHDDLLFLYLAGGALKAVYFDNEGHVIHYAVETPAAGTVRMISTAGPAEPRYRLTYRKAGDAEAAVEFEIAPPGKPEAFTSYVRSAMRRK